MNENNFKLAVGKFPTGVTIISTKYQDRLFGFTANSFASVSLNPPLVSFCLNKIAGSFNAFINSHSFAISILAHDQSNLASQFASHREDKFDNIKPGLTPILSLPVIENACAWLECSKFKQFEAGDHYIFVGEVKNTQIDNNKKPLIYFAKSYSEVK